MPANQQLADMTAITTPALTDLFYGEQGDVNFKYTGTQLRAMIMPVVVGDLDGESSTNGQVPVSQGDGTVVWEDQSGSGGSGTVNMLTISSFT